ncbi:hypothetical protein H310_00571 [Aphanomyces invadans]|uniref:G-protein coupled receptors family 3 profile domain-containing protein n=1 Tax=Aphanomyces invadans TaxID=157072 RepID=A0A024UX04_9STRA|nr:hypothetical protein H310_00571 [Aphanomyces invadans]ETW10213.1 hypothetical protein H310_00571 [Aphanomyces invadans]|eukprot:XP_008861624.1 hypothetical protein H310_00571 [Aphanomyces invadans]
MEATQPGRYERTRRTCLTDAWVAATAARAKLNPYARDDQLRLVYKTLQPALKYPRYQVVDPRQRNGYDPKCGARGILHGVGERVYANGTVAYRGVINGTFVVEVTAKQSQAIASTIMSILAQESVGYDVTQFETSDTTGVFERISPTGQGKCTPTHANVEVYTPDKTQISRLFTNSSISSAVGYNAQSGLYTLKANVNTALQGRNASGGVLFSRPYSADYWREYVQSNELINFYSVQRTLNQTQIGRSQMCPDTTPGMTCRNGCSKNTHCITAEGQGKPCLLVGMMTPAQDPGYFEALLTNSKIPAMFCFAGYAGLNQYVVDTMRQNKSIVFYHFEPDVFHTDKKGLFTRITFPRANSTATTSWTTNVNLVSTDFPASPLMKYYSDTMVHNPTLLNFLTNFALTPLDMTNLLASYDTLQNDPTVADPLFATACRWVQQNSRTWRGWIERLPLCTLENHLKVTITDSFDNMTTPVNTSQIDFRTISFAWFNPNPDNATEPYLCDGGIITVPPPLKTSRSVEWLMENADEWPLWMHTKPPCERLHYNYTIGPCTPDSTRPVTFFWRLPGRVNGSTECTGGIALPGNLVVECDYIPVASPVYESITMLTCIVIMFLVVCGILVVAFRKRSVVKRAQWPLLLLIVVGGILMCVYIILTGGEPTDVLCAARPILASLAFSVTFTAIFVKSLRVYLLFLAGENRKKIKVTLWKMIKLYLVIVVIDTGVVVIGLLADFPHPAISIAAAKTFDGTVDHYMCHSSTFIFKAMTIFFKTLVLIAGSYVAFLIRNADADFQESMWILASSVVVVVGAMILTPVAYFMDLDASSIFAIVSGVVLFCTVLVVVLMLGPKFWRLRNTRYAISTVKGASTDAGSTVKGERASSQVSSDVAPDSGAILK